MNDNRPLRDSMLDAYLAGLSKAWWSDTGRNMLIHLRRSKDDHASLGDVLVISVCYAIDRKS